MSDTEKIVDDVTDVTDFDTTDIYDEISYEQALEWKKKAERLEKAEKTLVEYKKKAKELEGKSEPSDIMTKADYAMEKFLDKNPELSEYKSDIEKYTKIGLTFEEAKVQVLNSDKAKQNRDKINSLGLSDGEPASDKTTITKSELEKLAKSNQGEYNRVRDLMDSGKIRMK